MDDLTMQRPLFRRLGRLLCCHEVRSLQQQRDNGDSYTAEHLLHVPATPIV